MIRILQNDLTPLAEGWGYLSTSKPVRLTTGSVRISVSSSLPAIPNVEFVEIDTPDNILRTRNTAPTKYDNYIADILRDTPKKASIINPIDPFQPKDTITLGSGIGNPLTPTPPHDYLHSNISWFGYTFYTTAYFKAGQTITCSSTAVGGVSHFLEPVQCFFSCGLFIFKVIRRQWESHDFCVNSRLRHLLHQSTNIQKRVKGFM